MIKTLRTFLMLLLAAIIAALAASVFSSQFVIAGLQDIGVSIPLMTRMQMTAGDLAILETLLLVFTICFIVAFSLATLVLRLLGGGRTLWYSLAGGLGVVVTLLILQSALELTPIAGARSSLGLIMQGLAGVLGGYTFARLTQNRDTV